MRRGDRGLEAAEPATFLLDYRAVGAKTYYFDRRLVRSCEVLQSSAAEQAAAAEDGDSVAERFDIGQNMRRKEDGFSLAPQRQNEVPYFAAADRVQAGHWFVHKD